MKKLTWLLVVGTIVIVPILLMLKREKELDENIRYDTNDVMTEESLS